MYLKLCWKASLSLILSLGVATRVLPPAIRDGALILLATESEFKFKFDSCRVQAFPGPILDSLAGLFVSSAKSGPAQDGMRATNGRETLALLTNNRPMNPKGR